MHVLGRQQQLHPSWFCMFKHTHTHMCRYIYIYINIYLYIHMHILVHLDIVTPIYIHTHTHIHFCRLVTNYFPFSLCRYKNEHYFQLNIVFVRFVLLFVHISFPFLFAFHMRMHTFAYIYKIYIYASMICMRFYIFNKCSFLLFWFLHFLREIDNCRRWTNAAGSWWIIQARKKYKHSAAHSLTHTLAPNIYIHYFYICT